MKRFYSDYAEHVLRNYFYPPKRPKYEPDSLNIEACDKTMETMTEQAKIILKEVLRYDKPLPECVKDVSQKYNIPAFAVWKMIDRAKFCVAKYRGLI